MDGQDSLWKAGWDSLPEELADVTEILDLLHALASLWEAAHLFRPPGTERKTAKILDTVHPDYRIRSSDFSDKTIGYRLSFGVNCPIF
jgi:hypothetical protein